VLIELDSLELIQACNGTIEIWSPCLAILAECFLKASNINSVYFRHCPRGTNQVAHHLAKYVYDSKLSYIWDGDPQVVFDLYYYMM
jgi:hypothetical protein